MMNRKEMKSSRISKTTQQFRDWRSSETANVTSKSSALYFQLRVEFKQPAIKCIIGQRYRINVSSSCIARLLRALPRF